MKPEEINILIQNHSKNSCGITIQAPNEHYYHACDKTKRKVLEKLYAQLNEKIIHGSQAKKILKYIKTKEEQIVEAPNVKQLTLF